MTTKNVTLSAWVSKVLRAGKAEGEHKAEFMAMIEGMDAAQLDAHVAAAREKITASKASEEQKTYAKQRVSTYASLYRTAQGFPSKRAKGAGRKAKPEKASEPEPVKVKVSPAEAASLLARELVDALRNVGRSERTKIVAALIADLKTLDKK